MKKLIGIFILLFTLISLFTSCADKEKAYENALRFLGSGEYAKAQDTLEDLGDYKDAKKLLSHFYYIPVKRYENGDLVREVKIGEDGLPQKKINAISDGQSLITDYSYDENGNILSVTEKNPYGGNNTEHYTYDETGKLLRKVSLSSYGERTEHTYSYDAKGNLTKDISTYQNGETSTIEYTYDEKGNLIQHTMNGTSSWTYTYDKDGNMIHSFGPEVFSDGDMQNDYTYDKNGNMIKTVSTSSNGGDTDTYDYENDSDGNPLKIIHTAASGETSITEYTYQWVYIDLELSEDAEQFILDLINTY